MTRPLQATLLVILPLVSLLAGCPAGNPGSGPFGGNPDGSGGAFGGNGSNGGNGGNGSSQPGMVIEDTVGPDGCTVVTLDASEWRPLHGSFTGGADPYFHLHSQEDVLFFGAELYTAYGAGWTGQTGTFAPDCGTNGICTYLVPDGETVTRAIAGEVDVISLTEVGGQLQRPAEVTFRNMTFVGTEDDSVCFHVEEVTLAVD
jgi:hypothetical protein